MQALNDGEWLNDEVISFYMALLSHEHPQVRAAIRYDPYPRRISRAVRTQLQIV